MCNWAFKTSSHDVLRLEKSLLVVPYSINDHYHIHVMMVQFLASTAYNGLSGINDHYQFRRPNSMYTGNVLATQYCQ